MPDFQFMFVIRGITLQRATTIHDRLVARLSDDSVTVEVAALNRMTQSFRVISVDTETREVFNERVEATDQQDAQDQVTGANPARVVALVRQDAP